MTTTVTECLTADHRRLDAIVPEVESAAKAGRLEDAASAFARFAEGLDRHIRAEEELLFPAFEEATGLAGGPTQVMRIEHVELRRRMTEISSALGAGDASAALRGLHGLTALLSEHNLKEESILYPMTDRAVPQASELAARVRSIVEAD